MQPSSQPFKEMPSLPPTYAIQPLSYPDDVTTYLAILEDIFRTDPNTTYIRSRIQNPLTTTLRRQMRLARFKNGYEKLTPEAPDTDTLYMKLIHLPTNTIIGASIWQLPSHTPHPTPVPTPSKTPYPLLPPSTSIPPEDAPISTIGPQMDTAMETLTSRIPQLGPASARDQKWWYLSTLGVVAEHQGKRLGQALVQWGVERAMADAAARPEAGIKGVWVTASEAGVRTYENAGFVGVGKCRVVFGDGKGGLGMRYDLGEGVEGGEEEGGQDFVVLVKEFV